MSSASFQAAWIRSKTLYASLILSSLPVVIGCSDGTNASHRDDTVGQTIQPIIRGRASGSEHDSVVILTTFMDGARRSLCTATLVAPNLVVTARHCVSDTDPTTACSKEGAPLSGGNVTGDRDPGALVVFVGDSGVAPDTTVESNGSARGASVLVEPRATLCNNDVAFVVLDRRLAAPIAPLRLGPPSIDETLAAVGWGIDETGQLPGVREVRADVPLLGLGPATYPESATYGYGDREFALGESACAGDSGSPALAKSGAVVGIAARAGNGQSRDPNNLASTCVGDTAHAVYTHLGSMTDLVARAFRAANAEIWLEGRPDPRAVPPPRSFEERPWIAPVTASDAHADTDADAGAEPAPAVGGGSTAGCNATSEPKEHAVEHAAGVVALLALLLGLRRRIGRADDVEPQAARQSMSSLP